MPWATGCSRRSAHGCACYPEDGDASQVRIKADSRMYAEKQHHHADDWTEEQS